MTTIINNVSLPTGAQPALAGVPAPPPLVDRLDAVDGELTRAEMVTQELVRRLEPVLPHGFGETPSPSHLGRDLDPDNQPSPLAARLADLAARGSVLVRQLQGVCEAVDL